MSRTLLAFLGTVMTVVMGWQRFWQVVMNGVKTVIEFGGEGKS